MPILSMTVKDALKNVLLPQGYYRAMFTEIGEPKTSKSGKSESYWSNLVITDGKYKGKEVQCAFNTATSSPSALGLVAFIPYDYLLRVVSSISNKAVEPEEFRLDTDELLNSEFDVKIEQTTDDSGVTGNAVVDFFPVGTATKHKEL